ncbi:MAG: hypothetical protein U1F29_03470 [Planctomycetota bacterium]
MYVRWIAPLLFAATASTAFAQTPNVLSGRPEADAVFARRLFERGQPDMAEAVCDLLEKSGKLSGAAEVGVKSLHIDLRLELAKKTSDLPKRKDLLKQALADKEDFIKQHQGTSEAEIAALTLPDAYALLGDTLKQMVQKETQPSVIADYQAEGQKVYAEAEERLKTRIEELTKLKDEKEERGEEDTKLDEQLMGARFNLPRTMYGHAQLYGKDEFRRKDLLEAAIKLLQEFGLDYTGVVYSYQATILEGQCMKELGQNDAAIQIWAELANSLKEGWETDKAGMFLIGGVECDLVSAALLQKALLLTELNRAQEAVPEIKEFFAKYTGAYEAYSGMALLAQLGEMQLAAGDADGASKTAQKLIDLDGNGPWGGSGRVLQDKVLGKGGGGNFGADKLLQLAGTQFQRRNEKRALELCRQAIADAKGDPAQSKAGLAAFLLMGDIFRAREWYHEATLAYDAGAERYPKEADAPEAVYKALQCLTEINKWEKRPYFKRKIDEHMRTLTTLYPQHPRASFALIIEGQGYEGDDDFLKAAQTYEKVQPDAKSYLVAQFSAGNAYFLHARTLAKDAAKKAEAKPFYEQAISILKKSITELDAKAAVEFDMAQQQLLIGTSFKARVTLAQVQLDENVGKPDEALKTLEGVDDDKRFNSNADNIAKVWSLRIQAYNKQGKLEDAVKNLDGLYAKAPDSPAIPSAARTVAIEFDSRAAEASEKKDEKGAEELWKRAGKYYRMAGQAMLKANSGKGSDVLQIADRLFTLGLILNKAPDSFLGWEGGKTANKDYWSLSADLYDQALRQSPSRKGTLYMARALGFLGQWERAADAYSKFFEGVQLVDPANGKFNIAVLTDKDNRELNILFAYLEWGSCENRAGKSGSGEQAQDRFANALKVFSSVGRNPAIVVPDSKEWWLYKYEQIQCLFNKGDFTNAGIELRQAKSQTNKLGGSVPGLGDLFKILEADIGKQTFNK